MISFFCPYCKHVLKAPEEFSGQQIVCEQCKLDIRVPHPAAPPPLPATTATTSVTPGSHAPWWKRVLRRGEVSVKA
jgi:hypothetical protein